MDKLDTALDDLDGLFEAFRAVADDGRARVLARNGADPRTIQRELAAAADAYAATLIASVRGDVDAKRIRKCRREAQSRMPTAVARHKALASLVNEKRLPGEEVRNDLKQLALLSLHCRAALSALAPTVDRRAAEAQGNKILVELRDAMLQYLASARESGDGDTARPRAAVVSLLERTEAHASELARLAPPAPAQGDALGAVLFKDVDEGLHKTALDWGHLAGEPRQPGVGSAPA